MLGMLAPTNWIAAGLLFVTAGTAFADTGSFAWRLPPGVAPPPVPADNPMSAVKVELGRRLFYDIRLSGPGYMSCASCHRPERAFADSRKTAVGVTGAVLLRNTPSLGNVGYFSRLTWAGSVPQSLEHQMLRPLFSETPVEMGARGHEIAILRLIAGNSVYAGLFERAFPEAKERVSFATVTKAIAAFQRTLVSFDSPYDRFRRGDRSALSSQAQRGLDLFVSDRLRCATCHVPPLFTDLDAGHTSHDTGLRDWQSERRLLAASNSKPDVFVEFGLGGETRRGEDVGKFRTPSLRNVELTAPYMHDGSVATLDDVIRHYASGGAAAMSGEPSPSRSPLVTGFFISEDERRDLIAFLQSLTDPAFLAEPSIQTPFR